MARCRVSGADFHELEGKGLCLGPFQYQSMRRPPKSAEIGVLRPGRSHIQAVFAPMAEEEGDIGLLSVAVWAFLAQCDPFLNKIEFVKDLSLRTKTCNKFFSQFLAEIVQR